MEWTTTKPSKPCVFVAAMELKDGWHYAVYELLYMKDSGIDYLVLCDNFGEEFDALEDFSAHKYLILPKH